MSFSFPTNLSVEEIQQCLADLQIHIDVNQFTKPSYDVIRPYFEQALVALTDLTREELVQPQFAALDAFEFPELHDESIPTNNFFNQLRRLMQICGVRDFALNDLFKPEPTKLKRDLCALINFAKFRDEKVALYDDLGAEVQEKTVVDQEATQEYEKSVAELNRLLAERAARQGEGSQVEAEAQQCSAHNAALGKQVAHLQTEVRNLKAAINHITDQASDVKLTQSSMQSENEQLLEQIVQSPEKHRIAIAELLTAAESQKTYSAALTSAAKDHDRKIEMIAKHEKELARCVTTQENAEGWVSRKKAVSSEVKDVRDAISKEERVLEELASMHATLRRQQASVVEKLARNEQQGALRLEAAQSVVENQQRCKEALEAEHAAGDAKAAEQEALERAWRERRQEVLHAKDTKVRSVMDKYAMLRKAVGEYNRKLEAAVSADVPGVVEGGKENDGRPHVMAVAQGMRALGISGVHR